MKSDLDHLMQERGIDAFVIIGTENDDTDRSYITNGAHASATVVKKYGHAPVLIVSGMEVDEAAKSGLQVYTFHNFKLPQIMKEHAGNRRAITREFYGNIFDEFEINGRLAFYGTGSVMQTWKRLNHIQQDFAGRIEIVEDEETDIFQVARRTKDADEITQLRESGAKTSQVLRATRDWLSTHRAAGDAVVNSDGQPLTIGDVKLFVRMRLMEAGMEDTEGMIFAQGRDAGVPHSRGEANTPLKVGQTIVFDLFPRPIGGGYYHDSTRTWCLGEASPEVEEAYRLVMHAFTQSMEALTVGQPTRELQELVCDIFESHGHPTPKSTPGTSVGYVHSLGHGVGLDIHEAPGIGNFTPSQVVFETGNVVSIEPGLYYPEKGWGIRVEDTVFIDESGHAQSMTDCPYDLVIPLTG
ncbi:MAG: aminopeptidase P family protein [Chloroflexi bacterium]|nr:aminopeptidase P family protein [Chloroflexota bacterium]